jgi:hypothetical protein
MEEAERGYGQVGWRDGIAELADHIRSSVVRCGLFGSTGGLQRAPGILLATLLSDRLLEHFQA